MAKYKQLEHGVLDVEEGRSIPEDDSNFDWQEYKQWLRDGHVVDPKDPEPEPTADELLDGSDASMVRAVDFLLDFLISKGTLKLEELPTELRDLYEARKSYFTQQGGIYTEESKLKKLWKVLIS